MLGAGLMFGGVLGFGDAINRVSTLHHYGKNDTLQVTFLYWDQGVK